jgi:hypothetical protein
MITSATPKLIPGIVATRSPDAAKGLDHHLDPGPAVDFEFLLQFGDAPPVLLMPGIWPVSIRCWRRQR